MSVLNKLGEFYPNISYTLTGHQICPKCSGKQFSITKDDSLGLCFSASCGFRIYGKNAFNSHEKESQLIDRIFRIFNKYFSENKESIAYKYCHDERKIEAKVLEKALIGEVCELPKDIMEEVETFLATLQAQIENLTNTPNKESEFEALKIRKTQLEKILDFLKNHLNYKGWLVTAFTDENLNILSLSFRKPYTKDKRASLKPFARKGIFGLNLTGDFINITNKKGLILVEGEFDVLQYHSSLIRGGSEITEPPIIAFGSALSPDLETIIAINAPIYLCRDNDDAGKGSIKKFSEKLNFHCFTVPSPYKDLDELLKPTNTKIPSYKIMEELIDSAEFIEMDFDKSIEMANINRDGNNNKAHRKSQNTTDFVIADLKEKGKLFKSKGRYFYLRNKDRLIYPILPKDEQLSKLLITFYKVNPSESIYGYIISELTNEAINLGKEAKTSHFTYYDKSDNSLFIYNFQDVVYLIKANGTVIKLKNGDKNILFLQTKNAIPFKVSLETKFEYSPLDSLLFNEIFNKGNFKITENSLTHKENAILFLYFFYTFLFMNKFGTRPIACFIGEKGSGKTTFGKMVGKLIYGDSFNPTAMPSKEDDFDALITNRPFHLLDNVDATPEWLADKLAVIATGGDIIKRELYNTNKLCEFTLDGMLCITSRTPRFTRDDIAERIIPLFFERLQDKGFLPENAIIDKLLEKRDTILSEIIGLHIPFILKAMEEFQANEFKSTFRMADFAEFSTLLSIKLCIKEEHDHIFKCLEKSQKDFALRENPLIELLEAYISLKESDDQKDTTFEIFNLIQNNINRSGYNLPLKSAQQFTQNFANNIDALRNYFNIEVFKERSNRTKYRITKIEDIGIDDEN